MEFSKTCFFGHNFDFQNETRAEGLAAVEKSSVSSKVVYKYVLVLNVVLIEVLEKSESPSKSLDSEGTKESAGTARGTTPVSLDVVNIAPGRVSQNMQQYLQ